MKMFFFPGPEMWQTINELHKHGFTCLSVSCSRAKRSEASRISITSDLVSDRFARVIMLVKTLQT